LTGLAHGILAKYEMIFVNHVTARLRCRGRFVSVTVQSDRRRRLFAALYQALAQFREYRAGTVKYPLFILLMILVLSTIAGCRGWDASADWARAHFNLLRR
jgi:hypothetical protein